MGSLLYFYASEKQEVAWWDGGVTVGTTMLLLVMNASTVVFLSCVSVWYGRVKVVEVFRRVKLCCMRSGVVGKRAKGFSDAAAIPKLPSASASAAGPLRHSGVMLEMRFGRRDTINPVADLLDDKVL